MRMGAKFDWIDLILHFVFDPHIDGIRCEHIALQQKFLIGPQRKKSFIQRTRGGGDLRQLFRRQAINIFIQWFAGIDSIFDSIDYGHQHRRKGQIAIAGGIRGPEFDSLGFG